MGSIQLRQSQPIPFKQMVDITAQSSQIARPYMIRQSEEHFINPVALARYEALAGLPPEAFHSRFQPFGSNV